MTIKGNWRDVQGKFYDIASETELEYTFFLEDRAVYVTPDAIIRRLACINANASNIMKAGNLLMVKYMWRRKNDLTRPKTDP
jgi:hypothetical protein